MGHVRRSLLQLASGKWAQSSLQRAPDREPPYRLPVYLIVCSGHAMIWQVDGAFDELYYCMMQVLKGGISWDWIDRTQYVANHDICFQYGRFVPSRCVYAGSIICLLLIEVVGGRRDLLLDRQCSPNLHRSSYFRLRCGLPDRPNARCVSIAFP
jgi:hypothetical protein